MLNQADLVALAAELATDTSGLGYTAHVAAGEHQAIADLLNAPNASISVPRGSVSISEIVKVLAAHPSEIQALTTAQRANLQILLSGDPIDPDDAAITAAFQNIFAGTQTLTDLAAFKNRPGSRAEQLFGTGTIVENTDVALALRG